MSANFDWQTDDEDYIVAKPRQDNRRRPDHRRWVFPALALLLTLSAAGVLISRYFQQRFSNATGEISQELLASHRLTTTAAAQADVELFELLVSNRDPAWKEAQATLLAGGYWARGPDFQPGETIDNAVAVAFSTDLTEAVVSQSHSYTLTNPTAVAASATFTHTAVYRRDNDRWLLSPPDAAFWGRQLTVSHPLLTLAYPERDAAVAERLAVDLNNAVAAVCTALEDLRCPHRQRLPLQMAADPDALITFSQPETVRATGPAFYLPAPTLFGLPGDEIAYQALYRAYASRVIAIFLASEIGWSCCRQAIFHQALLDKQLAQLGLRNWPIGPADYWQTLNHPVTLANIRRLWEGNATEAGNQTETWWAYAIVDFVAAQPEALPLLAAQQQLLIDSRPPFEFWLRNVTGTQDENSNLDLAWRRFLQAQITAQQTGPPQPWPAQDLLIMCGGSGVAAELFRYNPLTTNWRREFSERPVFLMQALADYSGLLMVEPAAGEVEEFRTVLWRYGQEIVLAEGTTAFLTDAWWGLLGGSSASPDPAGRQVLFRFDLEQEAVAIVLLALDACTESCDGIDLAGLPIWSPNGRQTILVETSELFPTGLASAVYRADHNGQNAVPVGVGLAPFWLGDATYGYLRGDAELRAPHELVIAPTDNDNPTVLLTAADFLAVVGRPDDNQLRLQSSLTMPAMPGVIFVTAVTETTNQAYLFRYDWPSGELSIIDNFSQLMGLNVSPDGRWLTVFGSAPANQNQPIGYLYDLVEGRSRDYLLHTESAFFAPASVWSADGQWLARANPSGPVLLDPATGYQYLAAHEHESAACLPVAWMNRP